jgi:uncharacterized protein (TIGR02302 family)
VTSRLTDARLARLSGRAGVALAVERLWRAAAPLLLVFAAFLIAAWLGFWSGLTPMARMAGVGLFALAFLAALWPFVKVAWPSAAEKIARVDGDSALAHRPAAALTDRLAPGPVDPDTQLLWRLHQKRAAAALAEARIAAPRADLAKRDPWALRIVALLAACGAGIAAGPEWRGRLMQPFDWKSAPLPVAGSRIDGWIDPPAYTRVAPTILTIAAGEAARTVKAPVNSTLVIRAAGASDLSITTSGGLAAIESDKKPADGAIEKRWTIAENGTVEVKRGLQTLARLSFEPIADQPPTVSMTQPPQGNARGTLTLNYRMEDDYGLVAAEAIFERIAPSAAGGRPPRPLVAAPRLPLSLPTEPRGIGEGQAILDLSSHPWAGARVKMTLTAKDEAGQDGASEPVEVTLPQRPFTKPLAKALVELRRTLVLDANTRARILASIDALMLNPERFTPEVSIFLGLKTAHARLRIARRDAELLDVADYLWGMAVHIEDGDLSQAERDLRAAQEALRQALERGATDEEIKRLTQDLRAALDKFMRELAEQMRRDGQQQNADQRNQQNQRTVRPEDLKRMIDRMEQMARQGARDEARKMLDDLQQMLDNLQTARPQQRGQDPLAREMNRALDELDKMIRDQQGLRDETFRQGQDQRGRQQQRADRNRQQQQQGQRGQQRQRQQGQQGQQGEQGDQGEQDSAENGQGQEGQGQSLAERQQRLRERLEELRRRMRGLGMNGQQMQEAEEAMRDAEGQLGQGREGQAADAQGRALDALRRGAQNFAQQMMDGLGDPNGDQADAADNGDPGNAPQNRRAGSEANDDPLGRPTRSRDMQDNSRVKVPRPGESASERAARVLEELRRRLGDPSRPTEELDYLRRLLSPY